MGQGLPLPAAIEWFSDPRTPVRRMKVAWHPDAGVVVLSLWAADQCTATFRLPIERAPDLMHLLVDAMADRHSETEPEPVSLSGGDKLRRLLRRGARRQRLALVIPFRRSHSSLDGI